MGNRINIQETDPEAYKAMLALERYLRKSNISRIHLELIKIRASQINGCAVCINSHTNEALRLGETNQRIFLLNAWRDTELFSEEERIILSITEEITLINRQGLTDETYQQAIKVFDENYISIIIMSVITINAWNRLYISTRQIVK